MKPVRIYLDTSDYARFYKQQEAEVYKFLLDKKEEGYIEIGFSYPLVWELLQEYKDDYKQDRINRAKCIHTLCHYNAFMVPPNIKKRFSDGFSRNGWWYTNDEYLLHIDIFVEQLLEETSKAHMLNSKERRDLKSSKRRKEFFEDNQEIIAGFLKSSRIRMIFTDEFIEKNIFQRYTLGKINKKTANVYLNCILSQLDKFIVLYYEESRHINPIKESFNIRFAVLKEALENMRKNGCRPETDARNPELCRFLQGFWGCEP